MDSNRLNIVFFVKKGLDSFLGDIILGISEDYNVKKIIVTDLKQIDGWMEWADICWFEWCDELVSYGSKLNIAKVKKLICRLHSYEAFTAYPSNVLWQNVDKVMFVAEHIRNLVVDNFNMDKEKTIVIPNGIDQKKWTFAERKQGFNIAYAGYINYKKGPMLLLHVFKAIYDTDNRYKLFIAGKFQDNRYILYFNQIIKEFGMGNNVVYEGWQDNLDNWLENKNYILCTSILESQNMSLMQAMSKGIKPIIHNFVGAKKIYSKNLIWNTIDEAVDMIISGEYNSKEYYSFVKDKFEINVQIGKIKSMFVKLVETKKTNEFDYKSYWNNRLNQKYDIEGVGYLGLGKVYNEFLYSIRFDVLKYLSEKLFGTLNKKSILELGPGIGMFTKFFSEYKLKNYCGIDISEKSCEELRKIYKNYKFILGDIVEKEHYGNEKFDLIFAADVLLHVTDEEKYKAVIKQLSKNIMDDGFIITFDPISLINTRSNSPHVIIRDLKYVEQILDENNLELVAVLPVAFFMNYPFDKKMLGNNEKAAQDLFDLILIIFNNKDISQDIKKDIGKWITTLEKQCLINNDFGLSQKALIISKKGKQSKQYNLRLKDIWDINNINASTEILKQKLTKNKEIIKYNIFEQLESKINKLNKKTDQPLVTIGITNYNGEKHLSECVDSFINQSYSNIEILLIDDCSTDGSKETIKNYEEKYKNIHAIYHNMNSGGASKGIQEIINNANGKYFQWIACDDFVEKDTVYKFVDYLEKNENKHYVFSDFNIVNEDSVKVDKWNYEVYTQDEVVRNIFNSASGIIPMNCLYRLSFFTDNKINWIVYKDNDFSADTLNSLQFIKYKWNYGKIDGTLINYRIHSNNLSHNLQKRINTLVSVFDYIIINFKEEIYIPEVKWDQLENRNQLKNYIIALFYYNQIEKHINMSIIPSYLKVNVTKEDIIKYCYIFAQEGMKYINEGSKQGDAYISKIIELKERYSKYIDEVKSLGVI